MPEAELKAAGNDKVAYLDQTKAKKEGKRGPPRKTKFKARKPISLTEASRFDWLNAIRSEQGPSHPLTRFVLMMASLHMKDDGTSCFPSLALLAEETGLSVRTVKKHMKAAYVDGWLLRWKRRGGASGYNHYEYRAMVPKHKSASNALY